MAAWEPLTVAALVPAALPSIGFRGPLAAVELAWACAVAMVSMGGAWAVWTRMDGAVTLARAAIISIAVRDLQALYSTGLPSGIVPGTRIGLALGVVVVNVAAWLAVARLSTRD